MVPYEIIRRKRDGGELPPEEITAFFDAYSSGDVTDYQMSAFLMAVYYRGLSPSELHTLVYVMLHSGAVVEHDRVIARKVDKHSTGGVGDKISLILAPLVSSLGVAVPMISGRGLGHTGGTLDKLETIPGFRTNLSLNEFRDQLARLGCALIGQTGEIAPLDKRLYALRDVTATVEAIPLIASSIMSKKLAEGIDALLLDVKRGSGAFLPSLDDAIELSKTMIGIGASYGCDVVALLTAMDRPLGFAIGNALEVEESILVLQNEGPADVRELTIAQAAEMLRLGGAAQSVEEGRKRAERALQDGSAIEQLRRIIEAQGGNPAVVDDPALLAQAPLQFVMTAERSGFVQCVDALQIGKAAVLLGAGRRTIEDGVDPGVGFFVTTKPGDQVRAGDKLATVHANTRESADEAIRALTAAIRIGDAMDTQPLPLISHRITAAGVETL